MFLQLLIVGAVMVALMSFLVTFDALLCGFNVL